MNIWKKFCMNRLERVQTPGSDFLLLGFLGLALVCTFLLNVFLGAASVSMGDAWHALFSGDISSAAYRIIFYVRLPRACAALLSGAALAVSGVLIQAVLNNSLAAPNIIGVNAGAGFAALLLIGAFPGLLPWMPVAAVAGALGASLLVYLLAARTGASRMTITLAGIALSSILTAGMNTIKVLFPDSIYNSSSFLMGGFSGVSYPNLSPAWVLILAGLSLALVFAKDIDVLSPGQETAMGLGMHVKAMRLLLLMTASLLAGAAVSFAGLLGFVGLIVPHIARRLVGARHRMLVPVSLLGGACFVLLCDLVSRLIVAPYELPVGIILSFVGGPFFLFLLLTKRRGRIGE